MRLLLPALLAFLAAPGLAAGLEHAAPSLAMAALDDAGSAPPIAVDADAEAALRRDLAAYRPRQTAYGLTFSLPDEAFAGGRADLRDRSTLSGLATYVLADPAIRLRVAGHADVATAAATMRARDRAMAVSAAMIAAGVPADRIETLDEGTDHPVADGTTAAARARNRRVEITLLGEQAAPRVALR